MSQNIDPDKLSEPKRALTIRAYQTPQPSDTPRYLDLNRGIEAIKLEIVKQEPLQIQFFCYLDEIQNAYDTLRKSGCIELALLQCTSDYPAKIEEETKAIVR